MLSSITRRPFAFALDVLNVGASAATGGGIADCAALGGCVGGAELFLPSVGGSVRDLRPQGQLLTIARGALKGAVTAGVARCLGPLAGMAAGLAVSVADREWTESLQQAAEQETLAQMQLPQAWQSGYTGKGVTVAVLDTGAAPHSGRVLEGFQDFVDGERLPHDPQFHGTAMSGAVAAAAPDAGQVMLRVGDKRGHVDTQAVIEALEWVEENRQRYNIQVLSMSFHCEPSPGLDGALARLASRGVIPVAGTSNDGPIPRLYSPACVPSVLVAGQASEGGLAPSSGIPAEGKAADVVARTEGLRLPVPRGGFVLHSDPGTSTATAELAGVLALWKQADPALTSGGARAVLQATSAPLPGVDPRGQGAGLVQAWDGLQEVLRKAGNGA